MIDGRTLGVLGGTFDPIHYGHLDAADAARQALALGEIVLVPAHDPPHKPADPHASAFHRFALASLAVTDRPGYRVSDVELTREGQSYTIDTLRALHAQGWQPSQLFFILGTDAFAEIATWYMFPAVLDAANFVVIARPGTTSDAALARTPELRARVESAAVRNSVEGTAAVRNAAARNAAVRNAAVRNAAGRNAVGRSARLQPGPATTHIFVVEARTRDVSSTTIRERLAARQPIDDLVPSAVVRHIDAHQLYGAVGRLHDDEND